jgi:hypothetical protein
MKFVLFIALLGIGVAGMAQSDGNTIRIDQAIQDLSSNIGANFNGQSRAVGSFVNFHSGKENTKGSRYLFADWVGGTVTTKAGLVISKDSLMYNYDKISHDLYLTDQKTVVDVDGQNVQAFTLRESGRPMTFVRLDGVQPDAFFLQLVDPGASGSAYGLYRLTKTSFEKANFHSDGMVESGHNYDEFIDEQVYYILMPGGKEAKKVELKKKSIREALASVKPKVDAYFNAHKGEELNENFLVGLLNAVNG